MSSKSKVYDDPLMSSGVASDNNLLFNFNINNTSKDSNETLSTVDFDKVKFKTAKPSVKNDEKIKTENEDISHSEDRFGLGVDLFSNLTQNDNRSSIFNDLMNKNSSEDDIFSPKEPVKSDPLIPSKVNLDAGKFRVAYEKDDSNLVDLKVTQILETEELDFDMFGKAKGTLRSGFEARDNLQKSNIGLNTTSKDEFELNLTPSYLNEMDKLTLTEEKPQETKAQIITQNDFSNEKIHDVSIDLNNLDFNNYIAQESSVSKGGLFD